MRTAVAIHGQQRIIHVVHLDILVGSHTYAYIVFECSQQVFRIIGELAVQFELAVHVHVELVVSRIHAPIRFLAVHLQGHVQRFGHTFAVRQVEHFVIRTDIHTSSTVKVTSGFVLQ